MPLSQSGLLERRMASRQEIEAAFPAAAEHTDGLQL